MSGSSRKTVDPKSLSVLAAQIEALLFLASTPVPESELKAVFGLSGQEITSALRELEEHLASGHGLVLKVLAGGWLLETNPHFAEVMALFRDTTQRGRIKLSKAAVETLSVVAYNQPVTRSEVEDLRGVRCERVIETLLSHGLIRISGRKKASGSPLLYRTTGRFLEIFGLGAVADLPTLKELDELGADPEEAEAAGVTEIAEKDTDVGQTDAS
ncbi:MAG: SMC-Scp complex subunit ScpB [Synergistaceae bacterium]|jgi:segregation and condensation protein B|nr:SMC-Scp complex subunit ScpB [Synergistaceae bacterium]